MPIGFSHQKPFFKAALRTDGVLELLIYEIIGENWWGDGLTAKTVKDQIDRAGTAYSRILTRINSDGGDAFEGIAIYNILRAQGKPVDVCVDGVAASSASIVAMAGDTITMGPNAMMMIHNAWGGCVGFAADMHKMGEALEKISGAIAQTYVVRTKKPEADILALMNAETWLTAQECLAEGFATAIVAESPVTENAWAMAKRFKALGRFRNLPDALKNAAASDGECQCDCASCQDGNCDECTNVDCDDPNCTDCPMQGSDADNRSNLSLYEARATMLLRKTG